MRSPSFAPFAFQAFIFAPIQTFAMFLLPILAKMAAKDNEAKAYNVYCRLLQY